MNEKLPNPKKRNSSRNNLLSVINNEKGSVNESAPKRKEQIFTKTKIPPLDKGCLAQPLKVCKLH